METLKFQLLFMAVGTEISYTERYLIEKTEYDLYTVFIIDPEDGGWLHATDGDIEGVLKYIERNDYKSQIEFCYRVGIFLEAEKNEMITFVNNLN